MLRTRQDNKLNKLNNSFVLVCERDNDAVNNDET